MVSNFIYLFVCFLLPIKEKIPLAFAIRETEHSEVKWKETRDTARTRPASSALYLGTGVRAGAGAAAGGSAVAPRLCPTRCAGQGLSLAKHLRLSPSVRRGWSINAILCVQRSFKGYAERCVQGENKSLFLLRAAGFESCWQLLTSDKVVLFPTRFIFMTDILKIMNKYLQRTSNKLKIIKVQRDEVQ